MKPLLIEFKNREKKKFKKFIDSHKRADIYNIYQQIVIENYLCKNPKVYFSPESEREKACKEYYDKHLDGKEDFSLGTWCVIPTKEKVFHLPDKLEYQLFRTIRNRDLITEEEQKKLLSKTIALAGLSVGSNVLLSFVRTGVGSHFRIADLDVVSVHNMNRANYNLTHINLPKIDAVSEQVYYIDPYIEIEQFSKGLEEDGIDRFICDADVIVDCFDNFKIKLELRKAAKRLKIPVISGFDISSGTMVIVERYDKVALPITFYLNGHTESEIFNKEASPKDRTNIFIDIVGREHHDSRMLKSVLSVGTSLTGYPQLSIATSLTASSWTYAAIDLLLGKSSKSYRKYIDLSKILELKPL